MIKELRKRIHPETGIIVIDITTKDYSVKYSVDKYDEEQKILLIFFTKEIIEVGGKAIEHEVEIHELINMKEDFKPFDYEVLDFQTNNHINLLLIPHALMCDVDKWKRYETD